MVCRISEVVGVVALKTSSTKMATSVTLFSGAVLAETGGLDAGITVITDDGDGDGDGVLR